MHVALPGAFPIGVFAPSNIVNVVVRVASCAPQIPIGIRGGLL